MKSFKFELSFPGDLKSVRAFCMGVRDLLRNVWPDKEQLVQDVELCLMEALSNVIFHAHKDRPQKIIRFQILGRQKDVVIRIYDSGIGFNLDRAAVQLPALQDDHGRGLFVILHLMDDVSYQKNKQWNYLQMVKKF
ncbi:serine/threonine-protein kinase BtrW [bacterium BMS3Abin05]|nr:serine/threonine-protein kinase BtrW [bacterium BMS3Abin05]GBE28561.1 serine/threonine-protein kinase BtrW [bacterium BMS3Bbin03]HDK35966.1 ATP-binding protein [Bacteroidota bacterium]HDL78458.1 ATP-binding protein [Bacteroidota bacterium]HDZ12343.1 ATP-binding protein [Bacteroidota bacterium]